MKKLLFLSVLGLSSLNTVTSQTIAAAKALGVGANVTVRGVVLNGSELGIIRYIQDYTGGIAAYGSPVMSLNKGDSVLVSGPLTEYYNLFEIAPPTVNFISANATLPAPEIVTPIQFGEPQEGKLIKILNCTFSATGNFSTTATNYTVTSNSQTFAVRSNTVLAGTPIPTGTVNIIGIGSQFCGPQSSTGCTKGYQLLPRTIADFEVPKVTGISMITKYSSMSVFPNPTSTSLSFKLSETEKVMATTITDIIGATVYGSSENSTEIDVRSFAKGFYTLFVTTENTTYKTKFIIE